MNRPLPLPKEIGYVQRRQVLDLLFLSPAQLRRDVAVLQELNPIGWHYLPGSRGFRRCAIEVLWEFRQLVNCMGRGEAIAQINQLMEQKYERSR